MIRTTLNWSGKAVLAAVTVALAAVSMPRDAVAETNYRNWDDLYTHVNGVEGTTDTRTDTFGSGTWLNIAANANFEPHGSASVNCWWWTGRGNNNSGGWHRVAEHRYPSTSYGGQTCTGGLDSDFNRLDSCAACLKIGGFNSGPNTYTCNAAGIDCYGTTRHRFTIGNSAFGESEDFYTSWADVAGNFSTAACWTYAGC